MKKNIKKIIILTSILASFNLFADINLGNENSIISNENISRENLFINNFEIKGLKNVNLKSLVNIDIKKGDVFNPDKIKDLMNKIISTGYFQNIIPNVSVDPENKLVNVELNIIENPIIKSVTINGLTAVNVENFKQKIGLLPNTVYNHYTLDPNKTPIIAELTKLGLLAPAIINANMDEKGNLVIDLSEGKISKIEYIPKGGKEDNVRLEESDFKNKTKDFILKRNQVIKEGDYLTIDGVKRTVENLFKTGLFESIEPKFEIDPTNPQGRVVIFEVEERNTASINSQISYSKESGLVGELSLSDKNFLGGQQEASVAAAFGTTGSYNFNLSYWNPYIKNTDRIQAGGKLYFNRDKLNTKDLLKNEKFYYKEKDEDKEVKTGYLTGELASLIKPYDTKTVGISGTVGKGVSKDIYISLKPKLSYSTANSKSGINLMSVFQGGTGISFNYDTRDDIYLPKKGISLTYTLEGNYIASDTSLTPKTYSKAKKYLLDKQEELVKDWNTDENGSKYYEKYNEKKEIFKKKNPNDEFNPEKEALKHTKLAKKDLDELKDKVISEFKNKVKDLRAEDGGQFSNRVYGKMDLELLTYTPIVKEVNSLAFRLHLGVASKSSPENSLYITDNYGKSLRGFNDVANTNFIISSTLENRFYINKYLQVVAFADAGIYSPKQGQTNEGYDDYQDVLGTFKNFDKNIKLSAGAGVRVNTPIGVLRLDYGLPLINKPKTQKGGKLSFGFGHTF